MSPLYLKNVRHLDWNTCAIRAGHLRVDPGPRGGIEHVDAVPGGAEAIECGGKLVTKSFAVGHHHIYSALARGMPPPPRVPTSFVEILELVWWRLDKALDTDMIRASAIAAGIDAARAGSTFIIDHHASPNAAANSLHVIAEALDEIGLSHLLCYELSDRDGPTSLAAGLDETHSFLENRQGLVGLHASFTVSDSLLDKAMEIARGTGTGLHVHVAEAESDQEHCMATYGKRCIERFAEAGALALPKTILAHCIHLNDSERALIAGSNAWVSQQAESNANNAVGTLDAGGFPDRVFIGTDGMHGDCLAAARAAYLAAQSHDAPSPVETYERLRRVHHYLAENDFEGDGENNLVVLDYDPPTPVTPDNWPAHVMYGLNRSHVSKVISDGRVVVDGGRCALIDEEKALAFAREQAARLWKKLR
ncbi:MAG: amidohydrolase family protein [Gemmatimonadetes bacterium]|nr:amidohydrolase family protein [Gemmatimonadota bacterium]